VHSTLGTRLWMNEIGSCKQTTAKTRLLVKPTGYR